MRLPPWDAIAATVYAAFFVAVVLAVPAMWALSGMPLVAFVLALPIVAWLAARLIVSRTGGLFAWMGRQAWKPWEGAYYEFNDVQVRVYADDDDLWFVADDVLEATGLKTLPASLRATRADDCRTIPGTRLTGLNMKGLEKLLSARREPAAGGFLLWAQREVVRPWERKRGRVRLGG